MKELDFDTIQSRIKHILNNECEVCFEVSDKLKFSQDIRLRVCDECLAEFDLYIKAYHEIEEPENMVGF